MTEAEILEQWRAVTASIAPDLGDPARWEDEPIDHFLHAFRPDGERLPALFAGLGIDDVLARLRVVFEVAGPETGHLYVVVSRPRPMTDAQVRRTARRWATCMAELLAATDLADDSTARLADRALPIEIVAGPAPPGRHPIDELLHEAQLEYSDGNDYALPALMLEEPFYMLACRYDLVRWLQHPAAADAGPDLFAPAAELWAAGVELELTGADDDLAIRAWRRVTLAS